jgi:hypothetical protein
MACFPGDIALAAMVIEVDPPASLKVAVPVIWLPLLGSNVAVALVGVFEQAATDRAATATRMKRCMLNSSSQNLERRMMAEVVAENNCRSRNARP